MSRIRGIEVKVQKEILQTRKYGLNEILKQKTEEQSSDSKDETEKDQIVELLHKLPQLDKNFVVHRKVGEGTFSSVYLGSLRREAARPAAERRLFAIKHLVPTAHPARVEHELRCLQEMGGKHHVIRVDLCLRHMDTIVFIMPYIPHRKFSEYVGEMDASELREYMRALLSALRHVHSFGVIHRDVKPSNFLYDAEKRRYQLVDFGLAQRLVPPPATPPPVAPAPPPAHSSNTRKRAREQGEMSPEAKRAALDLSVASRTRAAAPAAAPPCAPVSAPAPASAPVAPRSVPQPQSRAQLSHSKVAGACACGRSCSVPCACACGGRGALCAACAVRPAARAPRAGTQGYRPPEVLLKVPAQDGGVDVWACGVVLASALTSRYPLLRAPDDVTALAELCELLGTQPIASAAARLGRRLVTSRPQRGKCLRRLAALLRGSPPPPAPCPRAPPRPPRPRCALCSPRAALCVCRDLGDTPEQFDPSLSIAGFPDSAFALAACLLAPDPRRRPAAHQALLHPFFQET